MADQDYPQLYQQMKDSAQAMSDAAVANKQMMTADENSDVSIPGYGAKPSFSKQIKQRVTFATTPFTNKPAAQAAVDAGLVPNQSNVYILSADNRFISEIWTNNNGVLVDTGKREADGELVEAIRLLSEKTDSRTQGVLTIDDGDGARRYVDPQGRQAMAIEDDGVVKTDIKLVSTTVDITGQANFGSDYIRPMPEDSSLAWGFGDAQTRVALGGRKDPDNRVEYMGVPLTNIRGVLPGTMFPIGDSLTANGTDPAYAPCLNGKSWPMWASMYSDGSLQYVGQSATGGFTTAQVLATHLPNALLSSAYFVPVLAARNDIVQGINVDTVTIPNLTTIYDKIRKNGQVPIICSMAAQYNSTDDATRRVAENKVNEFSQKYALKYCVPYVDMRQVTVDPSTGLWIPGYSFDDISHPGDLGAQVMGKQFYTVMKDWVAPNLSRRPFSNTTPALTLNKMENPILLNSTSGVPTNWVVKTNQGTITTESGSTDFVGNKLKTVSTSDAQIPSLYQTFSVEEGKKYSATFKFKISNRVATTSVSVYFVIGTNTSTVYFGGLRSITINTEGAMRFNFEGVIPAGATQITAIVANRNCTLETGEFGFFELNTIQLI